MLHSPRAMPAKKVSKKAAKKKVAKKSPAKKATKKKVAKKAAKKSPAKKKAAPKKKAAKKAAVKTSLTKKAPKLRARTPSDEEVRKAAYLNFRGRQERGEAGDEVGDWLYAVKQTKG